MNSCEVVDAVAAKTNVTKKEASKIISAFSKYRRIYRVTARPRR